MKKLIKVDTTKVRKMNEGINDYNSFFSNVISILKEMYRSTKDR